jgi:hypothetical protein
VRRGPGTNAGSVHTGYNELGEPAPISAWTGNGRYTVYPKPMFTATIAAKFNDIICSDELSQAIWWERTEHVQYS